MQDQPRACLFGTHSFSLVVDAPLLMVTSQVMRFLPIEVQANVFQSNDLRQTTKCSRKKESFNFIGQTLSQLCYSHRLGFIFDVLASYLWKLFRPGRA